MERSKELLNTYSDVDEFVMCKIANPTILNISLTRVFISKLIFPASLVGKKFSWGDDDSNAREYANFEGIGGKDKWNWKAAPVA